MSLMNANTDWRQYVYADPAVLGGKPVLRGTRLSVEFLLSLLGAGWGEDAVRREYSLSQEQLRAVFAYAADALQDEVINPLPATP